jgi:uncharacterized membrane protein (DUF4010 family)
MRAALLFSLMTSSSAWAHDGHGMPTQVHWHATDVLGLVVVLGLAALAIWFTRGGK